MTTKLERLKALLFEKWDPIGIARMGGPRDEYDSYADDIFEALQQGVTEAEIAAYLDWAQSEHVCLRLRAEHNRGIAAEVMAIHRTES